MAKKILAAFLGFFLCLNLASYGQSRKCGLGLVLVEPTGLSGKMWLHRPSALAAGVGWSALEGHQLHIHLDYLFLGGSIFDDRQVAFSFYAGAGGKVIFRDNDAAWLRFPLGIDFIAKRSPLNIFFEVAPSFNFSEFDIFGALGIRYLFDK